MDFGFQETFPEIKGIGAIIGDIAGSPYEFNYTSFDKPADIPLFTPQSRFTDDTVMTLAVAGALSETLGYPREDARKALVRNMVQLGKRYPYAGYGNNFRNWFTNPVPYGSFGNGSAMRVSAVGWLYDDLDEVLAYARLTAEVSHNHPEGIKGAEAVAAAIFLARKTSDKHAIEHYISRQFDYDLSKTISQWKKIQQRGKCDISCQATVPQALAAYFEGDSFEQIIRLAIFLGGDTDTLAAIAGSIAEASYPVPQEIVNKTLAKLPEELTSILYNYTRTIRNKN